MEFKSLEEFDRAFFARYEHEEDDGLSPIDFPSKDLPVLGRLSGRQLQTLSAAISYGLISLLLLGVLMLVVPKIFKIMPLRVQSGSMFPQYKIDSLVWAFPTKFDKIKVKDDVSYLIETGQAVTHRVIRINPVDRTLTVKGIHNSVAEETVSELNIIGVVRFSLPKLGGWLDDTRIKVVAGLIAAALFCASIYLGRLGKAADNQQSLRRKQIAY